MSLSGLVKAYSVPSCRNTSYCSGVSCCFHSASVLITFLIPLDFVSCPWRFGFSPSPAGRGLTANAPLKDLSLDCAQLGSRDKSANPPTAIEDEINKRRFMIRLSDSEMPKDDIESYFLNSNYVRRRQIG